MSPKRTFGAILGGGAGGAIGSQFGGGKGKTAATIVGALLGAYAGVKLVDWLEYSDEQQIIGGLENTPPDKPGQVDWTNPGTKIDYTSSVSPAWNTAGTWCRNAQAVGIIDGKKETMEFTACRQEDGKWRAEK